ncbi:hypothetical protein LCGC14_2357720 [marine sediment metagenome]|uniref:Uncharacterized protein n=1 Tax=marine sediment metagenome TaxID=412755 RepID=A0A0F9C7S9_9ZZZZ
MKKISIILIGMLCILQWGCQKDPWEDIEEGEWNNERSILSITFQNQVGQAQIDRIDEQTGEVYVSINSDAVPDLSTVQIQELVLSYQAQSDIAQGESLNFENETNSSSITITSPTGRIREYNIIANPFSEDILGTYSIDQQVLYGGTGPEFGGGAVLNLSDKPWIWPANEGAEKELDNTLVFELVGITDDGNTYGTVTNNAGEDGTYANFLFVGDPETDVNGFYRKIPQGQGEWLRDYNTGTITFTFEDGSTTTGMFIGPGTEDLGNGLSNTVENRAFVFELNGVDDYDNIYSDYDKFVRNPRKYWIEITKQD